MSGFAERLAAIAEHRGTGTIAAETCAKCGAHGLDVMPVIPRSSDGRMQKPTTRCRACLLAATENDRRLG